MFFLFSSTNTRLQHLLFHVRIDERIEVGDELSKGSVGGELGLVEAVDGE